MSLALDGRQRAMLAEMGLRIFEGLPDEAAPAQAVVQPRQAQVPAPAPVPAVPRVAPPAVAQSRVSVPASLGSLEAMSWDELAQAVADGLGGICDQAARPVLGSGDLQPQWLVIGDPPEESEASIGRPFVGEAGTLLDNMLKAVGLTREDRVYLTNIMKCRPPGNRNPGAGDLAAHAPVLRRQIQLLQPKVIVVMGRFAVPALLETTEPIGKLRGRVHEFDGVPVVVSYHPAYLLRNPADKGKAWADLCLARQLVGDQAAGVSRSSTL